MWIFAPVWDVERRPWHYWNWQATADEEGLALASLSWWLKLCQSSYEKKNFLYFYISWIDIFGLIAKKSKLYVIEVGPFFLMLGRKLLQQLGKQGGIREEITKYYTLLENLKFCPKINFQKKVTKLPKLCIWIFVPKLMTLSDF